MSLDLDTRQRAMLQEMGVHVWLPLPKAVPLPVAVAAAPSAPFVAAAALAGTQNTAAGAIEKGAGQARQIGSTALIALKPQVASSPELPAGIADMDWPALSGGISQCQACKLCTGRRAPVFESAHASLDLSWHADWLIVADPPDEHDEREGAPLVGEPGLLLDNMLKAVGVYRCGSPASSLASTPVQRAFVTQVVKCRTSPARNPSATELATCAHFLRREVALVQPKIILVMGRFAAQTLLHDSLPEVSKIPYGQLRGKVYEYQGIPVVVTYPPANLIRTPLDKARAWADLCLAMATLRGR